MLSQLGRATIRMAPVESMAFNRGSSKLCRSSMGPRSFTADGFSHPRHLMHHLRKHLKSERLGTVGHRAVWIGMHFHDESVCTRRNTGPRHGDDAIASTDTMGGIDDHGKWVSDCNTGTAFRSRVLRVEVSKVRTPRSQRMIS